MSPLPPGRALRTTNFRQASRITKLACACLPAADHHSLPADKKGIDGQSKRKYISKLIFIFLLGHDVDFGQLEAVNLLSSFKLSEKQAVRCRAVAACRLIHAQGYLFVSVMLNETSELNKLILQAIKIDLASRNELEVSLALNCLANIGGKEFAPSVIKDVLRLLVAQCVGCRTAACLTILLAREAPLYVRKKAALCSLRFFRRAPEEYPHGEFGGRIVQMLSHQDLVCCAASAAS